MKEMNDYFKLTFTGDIMCSQSMDEYCHTEGNNYNYHCLFDNIKDRLSESNYVIGNLETTISGEDAKYTSSCGSFNTPKQFLQAIKHAGIKFVTTANNHILDRGISGMINTLNELDKMGIRHAGTYRENEIKNEIIEFNSCRIAILSFTYGTNSEMNHCYLDDKNDYLIDILRKQPKEFDFQVFPHNKIGYLIERIKRRVFPLFHIHYDMQVYDTSPVKSVNNPENRKYENRAINKIFKAKENADIVFVCLHSGGQYNNKIGEYTKYITSKICETGVVDAIITNHPHCILPHTFIGKTLVTYGLGNFTFTPDEWTRHNVLCNYNILLHAKINTSKKTIENYSFSIVKNKENINGIMKPINIYDLNIRSKKTLREIQKIFKRFGYRSAKTRIQKEYIL